MTPGVVELERGLLIAMLLSCTLGGFYAGMMLMAVMSAASRADDASERLAHRDDSKPARHLIITPSAD